MTLEINTFFKGILVATFLMFSLSCGSSKNNVNQDTLNSVNQNSSTMTVKMIINYTSDYCGGAYPSEDILEGLKKERPLAKNNLFIFKEGEGRDKMSEVVTAEDGTCTMELTPGKYHIYLPEKLSKGVSKFISQEDCDSWKNTPNATFEVTADDNDLTVNLHKTCNPCHEPPR